MVIIDHDRCTYCGGCVSVCPVVALTLRETRLEVSEVCIDCDDCITACPVGAIKPEFGDFPEILAPIRQRYDVVVVGAGPGGSTAAFTAAQAGLSVLLLEKRQEIGSPVRCAEGVGHEQLIPFIDPDPLWVAAEVDKAEINLHRGEEKSTIHAEGGHGYILERRVFDRVLAERAAQAGAEVRVKTAASGLLMDAGKVFGVKVQRGDFLTGDGEVEIETQIVIAADGVEAQVGRWAGMDLQLHLQDTMVCVQYLLAGIDIDPRCTSYAIGYEIAPGGYAWIFPKGEGKANVGLGVQADLWMKVNAGIKADQTGVGKDTVLGYLTRFIESDPRLAQGFPVSLITGNVPIAPIEKLVTHGLMLVGDAARQVDPLTGGGIVNAMQAGKIAAQVAAQALITGDTSIQSLGSYQDQWDHSTGRKLKRNNRLRGKFPPQMRTDERFVRFFALAAAG